jgi:hypothetical protein
MEAPSQNDSDDGYRGREIPGSHPLQAFRRRESCISNRAKRLLGGVGVLG